MSPSVFKSVATVDNLQTTTVMDSDTFRFTMLFLKETKWNFQESSETTDEGIKLRSAGSFQNMYKKRTDVDTRF